MNTKFRHYGLALLIPLLTTSVSSAISPNDTNTDTPSIPFVMGGTERHVPHWKRGGSVRDAGEGLWLIVRPGPSGVPVDRMATAGGFEVANPVYSGDFVAYKIRLKRSMKATLDSLKQFKEFQALETVLPSDKVDGRFSKMREVALQRKWARSATSDADPLTEKTWMQVRLASGKTPQQLKSWCDANAFDSCSYRIGNRIIILKVSLEGLEDLSRYPEVEAIHPYEPPAPLMQAARALTRVDNLQAGVIDLTSVSTATVPSTWNEKKPYTGEGIWAGIFDTGIDPNHPDLQENGSPRMAVTGETWSSPSTAHGTHVAGIVGGNGRNSEFSGGQPFSFRGVAPKVKFGTANHEAYDVNNHSHTWNTDGIYYDGMRYYDSLIGSHISKAYPNPDNNISVYAVGNNGIGSPGSSYGPQQGYFSILASPLNHIKVGAVNKWTGDKCALSSLGPTRDGRIGPDVMAPGCGGSEDQNITVEIDYVRVMNGKTVKVVDGKPLEWNFQRDQDVEWLNLNTTSWPANNISTSDYLTYTGRGLPQIVSLFPNKTDVLPTDHIEMRIRITPDPNVVPPRPFIEVDFYPWYTEPSSDIALNGYTNWYGTENGYVKRSIKLNEWVEVDFPVGRAFGNTHTFTYYTDPVNKTGLVTVAGCKWSGIVLQQWSTPELINSVGWNTLPEGGYYSTAGTSMAAPHVTGIVALMLQKYNDDILKKNGSNPHDHPFWNSTARGILVHTATDMVQTAAQQNGTVAVPRNPDFAHNHPNENCGEFYGVGPDWATGYGLVNAQKAVRFVDPTRYVERTVTKGATMEYKVTIPSGTTKYRSTLVWDDEGIDPTPKDNPNISLFTSPLSSNLDIEMISPSGVKHLPWVIDAAPLVDAGNPWPSTDGLDPKVTRTTILANQAKKGVDNLNNVEVVDIDAPEAGTWTIRVIAKSILSAKSKQDFSLVSDLPIKETPAGLTFSDGTGRGRLFQINTSGVLTLDQKRTSTIPATGLKLVKGTTKLAGLQRNSGFGSASISESQSSWLGTTTNLAGGLVLKAPGGTVVGHLSSSGALRLKSTYTPK